VSLRTRRLEYSPSREVGLEVVVHNGEEKILGKRRTVLLVLLGALLLVLGAGVALAQGAGMATAELKDKDGNTVGNATFTEGPGGVTINATLQPGQEAVEPGEHGIHIHETGSISPDFEAAGKHFNPSGAQHGFNNPEGPHEGDLENIVVNPDGSASYTTTDDRITLFGGQNAILDSDGAALVIHKSADDYQTDPSGESGDRVAAGIIRESATGESTTPAGTTTPAGDKNLPKSGGANILLPAALGSLAVAILAVEVLIRRMRRT
jgi:Cu-Zn family superoxide dismutase